MLPGARGCSSSLGSGTMELLSWIGAVGEGLQHPSGRRMLKCEVTFFVCSMYQTKAVLIAMLITAIVAIVVTIFCFQTKARRGMHPILRSVGQVWGAGQWGHPGLFCDIYVCVHPHQVDFTSCPGLFCVLGIVVMVTGIITAIVLSFKYVSGEDRGAVECRGYFCLDIPRADAGRGFGWSLFWEAGCGTSPGRHWQQLLKSWVWAGPALPCLLPASTPAHPARVPFPHRSPGSTCCTQPSGPSHSHW